ncbi:hypothetical protein KY284_035895 [Solanum tuberosum]|nr:hypothetical protein KY284_035895 [Solanum tuberosum]
MDRLESPFLWFLVILGVQYGLFLHLGDIYHQMESNWCWYKQYKSTVVAGKVESIAYAVEPSKNDSIPKKNKSIEPLEGMNDLWNPLNKLVTKVDTLDNS